MHNFLIYSSSPPRHSNRWSVQSASSTRFSFQLGKFKLVVIEFGANVFGGGGTQLSHSGCMDKRDRQSLGPGLGNSKTLFLGLRSRVADQPVQELPGFTLVASMLGGTLRLEDRRVDKGMCLCYLCGSLVHREMKDISARNSISASHSSFPRPISKIGPSRGGECARAIGRRRKSGFQGRHCLR